MRLLMFLLLVSPVFAFPQLLSLDGFLTNSSGSASNGSFSFVFSLYNVSSAGTALWTETQTLTVSSGKLNALLGSVNALNLPFDQDYYLGVKVSTDSEMSPRYRVASSAYAYTAAYADTAKNLAPNATALGGLKFGDTASACDSSSRGTMKYVSGGSGVADSVFQCMKKLSGNYSWIPVKRETGISATGGVITESGGYRIHTFVSNGTFTVSDDGNIEVLVVAGGGGGGAGYYAGGGGAGGLIYEPSLPVVAQAYSVSVGAGGAGSTSAYLRGAKGQDSAFLSLAAVGGGGGGSRAAERNGGSGGSGGGASWPSTAGGAGTAGQGNAGGTNSASGYGSAGGGAGAAGLSGDVSPYGREGANGLAYSTSCVSTYYAGGGAGASASVDRFGGSGGGGRGAISGAVAAGNGASNTGGGGGGGSSTETGGSGIYERGGNGGSGVVIIRYLI